MQREIVQLTCDGCGKTAQKTGKLYRNGLPNGWSVILIQDVVPNQAWPLDVCSSGCAENAAIAIIREHIYRNNPPAEI